MLPSLFGINLIGIIVGLTVGSVMSWVHFIALIAAKTDVVQRFNLCKQLRYSERLWHDIVLFSVRYIGSRRRGVPSRESI